MASSGNFCTLNPLAQLGGSTDASTRAGSMSDGNLKYVNLSNNTAVGNFGVTSGKWYYEVYVSSFNSDNGMTIGWANDLFNLDAELGYNSPSSPSGGQAFGLYSQDQKLIYGPGDGSSTYNKSYGSGTPTDGDIIRIWLDADNGRFWAGLNGTIWGSGDPSAGSNWGFGTGGSPHNVAMTSRTLYPAIGNWSGADATVIFNFGQDSTFQGNVSAGGNADGNGFGDFKYDPDGFLALCSANLPISADIDPAETDDDYPAKQFNTILYTGNSSTNAISGLGFQPDMVWIQRRSGGTSYGNGIIDSSRGVGVGLFPDRNDADTSFTNDFSSFDSDGFTLKAGSSMNLNNSSSPFVAHCWRANGGTTSSNSEGNITSTVQANTKAGFSIITYTGSGGTVSGDNPTFGHGLESAPDFLIFKCRSNSSTNWIVWHSELGGASKYLSLNATSAVATDTAWLSNTAPSSTLITTDNGGWGAVNGSSRTYVCYAWHSVDGYSKFGTYEGNGSADGPFIYTGFRPRLLAIKNIDVSDGWVVVDTAREVFNPVGEKVVNWEGSYPEYDPANVNMDILSTGFKLRNTDQKINSSHTFIYMCWGDVSFKYNNTF